MKQTKLEENVYIAKRSKLFGSSAKVSNYSKIWFTQSSINWDLVFINWICKMGIITLISQVTNREHVRDCFLGGPKTLITTEVRIP